MHRTENGKNKIGKNTLIYIAAAVMIAVVFAITAIFSVVIHRTIISVTAENAEPQYRYGDIYYNTLNYRMQCLYDSIVFAASNHESKTEVVPYYYTEQEFERVIKYIKADNPHIFWTELDKSEFIYDDRKCRVNLSYTFGTEMTEGMKTVLDSAIENIKAEALKNTDGTKNSIAVWLHDYIIKNCRAASSVTDHTAKTAYGALVNGNASADGYSAAYKLLCDEFDIYCLSVYGRVYSTDHMWNLIWDGSCYRHIDVMWDDPDLEYIPGLVSHAYFGLSDGQIGHDHMILRKSLIPDARCDSIYYSENNMLVNSETADRDLRIMIEECIKSGNDHFEFVSDMNYEQLEEAADKAVSAYEILSGQRLYSLSVRNGENEYETNSSKTNTDGAYNTEANVPGTDESGTDAPQVYALQIYFE